ncbi:MAG TPA: sugar ABC transporter permease [Candidatus Izemoplasmatales bacterium]|nr:sugar ABC transporter permease [Candidatus Izemoplasmatales bacterium]
MINKNKNQVEQNPQTQKVNETNSRPNIKNKNYKREKKIKSVVSTSIAYGILIALVIVWLYPILWIVLHSFREEYNTLGDLNGIIQSNYFPKNFGLGVYKELFTNTLFPRWFLNTLMVAIGSFVISTFMQLSVAYVMSKIKFEKRKLFLNVAIILGLFPGFMSMIAVYFVLKAIGLSGTLYALVLVYSAGAGLGFYIAKGFFDIIPNSLVEAAKIDGATNARIFTSIILPISKPIIIYTALMTFIGPWMDFIFARVILGADNPEIHTVAIGLYDWMYSSQNDSNTFTLFAAGSVIVAIPIVILFISLQRYYVEGVTSGSVK